MASRNLLGAILFSFVAAACGPNSDPCEIGTVDCACADDSTCDDGLICHLGACLEGAVLCGDQNCMPEHPLCYSPCKTDHVDEDGTLRSCSAEGLMDGCIGDTTCIQGSCVHPALGELAVPTCASAAQCPDFQTCLAGKCVSTCSGNFDCNVGSVCHRKVCRENCQTSTDCSESRMACSPDRVCTTIVAPQLAEFTSAGIFEVEPAAFDLDPDHESATFTIHNRTPIEVTFLVRKAEHRIRTANGGVEVQLASRGDSPLLWVHLGAPVPVPVQELPVAVPAYGSREVSLDEASIRDFPSWDGVIEIDGGAMGVQRLRLHHTGSIAGRWAGKVYYFGNFSDGSQGSYRPLDDWRAQRDNANLADRVPNAFIKAWVRFRNGLLSFEQMTALLQSTITGSWQFPRVQELCGEAGFGHSAACAPFGGSGSGAVIPYTSASNVDRIPSGTVELNFAMHLTDGSMAAACNGDPNCFVGRIESEDTLQYAGNPEVLLSFEGDPADPAECNRLGGTSCISYLAKFSAELFVGGRHLPGSTGTCSREGFESYEVPWLVPGFDAPGGGDRTKTECRDTRVPFEADANRSLSFAGANPVPDGIPRRRTLELVDGVAFNQQRMLFLMREAIEPFHGGVDPIYGYALVVLERANRDLRPDEVQGNSPTDDRVLDSALRVGCSFDLIEEVIGRPSNVEGLTDVERNELALASVTGRTSPRVELPVLGAQLPSYLCMFNEEVTGSEVTVERQVFGAGADGTVACPPGSLVIYFAYDPANFPPGFQLEQEVCNLTSPESCFSTLNTWAVQGLGLRLMQRDRDHFGAVSPPFDLAWECGVAGRASCDDDLLDLRAGKAFYVVTGSEVLFSPLATEIHQAFRYRTQFASRAGKNIGFSPTVCRPGADLVPYCYDPGLLGRITGRIDCALELYHQSLEQPLYLDTSIQTELRTFLRKSFGVLQQTNELGDPVLESGFEKLFAELLINLGDDAVTKALGSRFDVSQSNQLSFSGSRFEFDGVDVSGIAGFELFQLYRATQLYEMLLDRFYALTPKIWHDITGADPFPYVTQTTTTTYLNRVIRASAQLSNAWSEIAQRYQSLNRPDLAKAVLERSYSRSYQESMILTEIMNEIAKIVSPAEVAQIAFAIEQAQRRFRIGMLAMQDRHDRLSDGLTAFGFASDYIPFPALDEDDINGFEVMMDRAMTSLDAAAEQEQRALDAGRDFDVDEADFQAELVDIRNTYRSELGSLCGTFVGEDGRVYPAISEYGHLSDAFEGLDDPCGARNGDIWVKMGDLDVAQLDVIRVQQEISNSIERARMAEESVAAQCRLIMEDVRTFLAHQNAVNGYEGTIEALEMVNGTLDKLLDMTDGITSRLNEVAGAGNQLEISTTVGTFWTYTGLAAAHLATTSALEVIILEKQGEIRARELEYETYNIGRECTYLTTELAYTLREIHLDMDLLELNALETLWNVQTELALLESLENDRRRLLAEWKDAEQLAVDSAAALTDPNVRIFKNDAVISADHAFERALRDAYRATKVFEYYTAQSYPEQEQLYFARMVDGGDYNLRRYLADLDDAYFEFEDGRGNPDTRIARISLRDDVLKIPVYSEDGSGAPMTLEERVHLFRERLLDPALLDHNGWITIGFHTSFDQLSPITYNHKILFIEAEMFGDTGGDPIGRVYLRQTGTGVVENSHSDRLFFAFPRRTAVINPVLNGNRDYGQDSDGAIAGPNRSIFRSFRFRERPLVNTNWELVLNMRTEAVNQDINIGGLDDIEVHVFYTDFTND